MKKAKHILAPLVTFIIVFILHLLYFKITERNCEAISWFHMYIRGQEYLLGISYALSIAFITFSFLKFKENRKNALKAATAGGFFTIILWLFCFLSGCCGSPMLIVYLNLLGISGLKIPKLFLLLMTIIFIGAGFFWLIKRSPKSCYGCKPCDRDKA